MNKFLEITDKDRREFVSRAGEKLKFALDEFDIDIKDKICADLGCSTGGFTDCLLQKGAKKVYSVDTGKGVLEWKLREDDRVVVMESENALHIKLPEKVDFISIDVGWTPQKLIIPKALDLLKDDGEIISLIKPHYEVQKSKVSEELTAEILKKSKLEIEELGGKILGVMESPITGKKGKNKEYLIWIHPVRNKKSKVSVISNRMIRK